MKIKTKLYTAIIRPMSTIHRFLLVIVEA